MHKEMAIIELVCGILTIVFLIYTVKIKGNLLVVAAVGGIVYLILGEMGGSVSLPQYRVHLPKLPHAI